MLNAEAGYNNRVTNEHQSPKMVGTGEKSYKLRHVTSHILRGPTLWPYNIEGRMGSASDALWTETGDVAIKSCSVSIYLLSTNTMKCRLECKRRSSVFSTLAQGRSATGSTRLSIYNSCCFFISTILATVLLSSARCLGSCRFRVVVLLPAALDKTCRMAFVAIETSLAWKYHCQHQTEDRHLRASGFL